MEYSPSLVERVHAEYREMPGLSLTVRQASRLWGMHLWVSEMVLEELVAKGILYNTRAGTYVAAPPTRGPAE